MKIYIDQGHNPQNPDAGIEINGYREQDLVYETGFQLDAILKENGFETRLSRPEKDSNVGSSRSSSSIMRIDDANVWGADYYIGLHTGASSDKFANGSGAVVYRLMPDAMPFAEAVMKSLHSATKLQNRGVTARTDSYMLHRAKMPAAIVELGFITNSGDVEAMVEHPELFAEGIANGIISHINSSGTSTSVNTENCQPFYQLYPSGNNEICRLSVHVYSGKVKRQPISKAEVTVYNGIDGKHMIIYRGLTNSGGNTMPIELPLCVCQDEQPVYMFCICVRHPEYLPKNQWIKVSDERVMRQMIDLTEKKNLY